MYVYIFKLLVFSQGKVDKRPIFVNSRPWYGKPLAEL